MQMIRISAHLDDAGGTMSASIKEKLCSGFLIREALCKVRVYSEYCVIPRVVRRNAYQHVLEFNRGRIVELGISRL